MAKNWTDNALRISNIIYSHIHSINPGFIDLFVGLTFHLLSFFTSYPLPLIFSRDAGYVLLSIDAYMNILLTAQAILTSLRLFLRYHFINNDTHYDHLPSVKWSGWISGTRFLVWMDTLGQIHHLDVLPP